MAGKGHAAASRGLPSRGKGRGRVAPRRRAHTVILKLGAKAPNLHFRSRFGSEEFRGLCSYNLNSAQFLTPDPIVNAVRRETTFLQDRCESVVDKQVIILTATAVCG